MVHGDEAMELAYRNSVAHTTGERAPSLDPAYIFPIDACPDLPTPKPVRSFNMWVDPDRNELPCSATWWPWQARGGTCGWADGALAHHGPCPYPHSNTAPASR